MNAVRKSALAAVAFAVVSASALVAPVTSAQASGYGYYSPSHGYYYSCRWVKYRVWTYYGWQWKKRRVCN